MVILLRSLFNDNENENTSAKLERKRGDAIMTLQLVGTVLGRALIPSCGVFASEAAALLKGNNDVWPLDVLEGVVDHTNIDVAFHLSPKA